jgi:hypothetical protein
MAHEPSPDIRLVGRLRDAVAATNRIRDEVITVTGLSQVEKGEMAPVNEILVQLAGHLEEGADRLAAGEVSLPALDLDDLLTDLDHYLASLAKRRRAEVAAGTAMEASTPLDQDLRSVAAVRGALRGMYEDVRELDAALSR